LQKNSAALDPLPPSRYLFTASMSDLRRCANTGSGSDTAHHDRHPAGAYTDHLGDAGIAPSVGGVR
jgi:hypothetical protein